MRNHYALNVQQTSITVIYISYVINYYFNVLKLFIIINVAFLCMTHINSDFSRPKRDELRSALQSYIRLDALSKN